MQLLKDLSGGGFEHRAAQPLPMVGIDILKLDDTFLVEDKYAGHGEEVVIHAGVALQIHIHQFVSVHLGVAHFPGQAHQFCAGHAAVGEQDITKAMFVEARLQPGGPVRANGNCLETEPLEYWLQSLQLLELAVAPRASPATVIDKDRRFLVDHIHQLYRLAIKVSQ